MNRDDIVGRLEQKDRMVFGLSDTIDVKASMSLALITLLATQAIYLRNLEMGAVVPLYFSIFSALTLSGGWAACPDYSLAALSRN